MPIPVISKLKPINNGQFPVVEDIDIQGGYQVRQNLEDLNSIPEANKKIGMLIYVVSESKYYTLSGQSWVEANLGGNPPPTGRRYNNSPHSHHGSMFVGPTYATDNPGSPLHKTLSTVIGAQTIKILYDPTSYTLPSTVPNKLGYDIPTQGGPYIWFNRKGSRDIVKLDTSSLYINNVPLDDISSDTNIKDIAVDYVNHKFYALDSLAGIVKVDSNDLQIDKVINLFDQSQATVNNQTKHILFDSLNNRIIAVPRWGLADPVTLWSINSDDTVTQHDNVISLSLSSIVKAAEIIDGSLWILMMPDQTGGATSLNLYKINLSTMQSESTYQFDISVGNFQSLTAFKDSKLVKNPNLPYMYMLSRTGYIYRVNLNDNTSSYLNLSQLERHATPSDMTFDLDTNCIWVSEVSRANIIQVIEAEGNMSLGQVIYTPTTSSRPKTAVPITIEYVPSTGVLISDINNDAITRLTSGTGGGSFIIEDYISLIGKAEWRVPNIQNIITINIDNLTNASYTMSQDDQIVLVYNYLNVNNMFTTVNVTLPESGIVGATVTIKDTSGIVSQTGQPLITISSQAGTYIEYLPPNMYPSSININQALTSVTLSFDGTSWRIISSYVPSAAISIATI